MEKKEVKMAEKCCLNCANLLTCPDILNYKCKKYEKAEPKEGLTAKYIEQLNKVKGLVNDLVIAINDLVLIETEQKVVEKVKAQEPEEKPAISKRNKEIVELVKKGRTVEEIAEELELKPETVTREMEYLVKIGVLKHEGSKVIVLKPA